MKLPASFARLIPFTNVLTGLSAMALCLQTALLLDWLFIPGWFYVFVCCNAFLLYALHDRFAKPGTANAKACTVAPLHTSSYVTWLIVIAAFVSVYLCFKLSSTQLAWESLLLLPVLAYFLPVIRFKKLPRYKQNNTAKLFITVIAWVILTTVMPATFIPYGFDAKFWWLLFFRLLFIPALYIPAYLRNDINATRQVHHTPAPVASKKPSYLFSYAALIAAALSLIAGHTAGIPAWYLAAVLVSLLITVRMIKYSSQLSPVVSYLVPVAAIVLQTMLICIPALFS